VGRGNQMWEKSKPARQHGKKKEKGVFFLVSLKGWGSIEGKGRGGGA